MSRLVSAQISGKKNKNYICNRCLNAFGSDELLEKHLELCSDNDWRRKPVISTTGSNSKNLSKCPPKTLKIMERKPFVMYVRTNSLPKTIG
jgi:hypothetical protein